VRGLISDHGLAVALVADVTRRRRSGERVRSFQQCNVGRSMRPLRPGAAGARPGVVVVAVAAFQDARDRPRRDQARHVGASPGPGDGMKGRVAGGEFQACIGLRNLARYEWRGLVGAVGVAAEADLIFGREPD